VIEAYTDPELVAEEFAEEYDLTPSQHHGIYLWILSIFDDLMMPTRVAISDPASWTSDIQDYEYRVSYLKLSDPLLFIFFVFIIHTYVHGVITMAH